jgi:hypothetical protein
MVQINESDGVHKQWYEDAKKVTLEELPGFLNRLLNDYGHDYGTICHALAAGSIAAAGGMNKSKQGGITGFQAGAVMWEFIRNWNYSHNKCGLRIVDFDNFLYPQYSDQYQKTISPNIWDAITKEAHRNIEDADQKYAEYLIAKEQYDKDITAFIEKHPDYHERKEYYDHLDCGTGDEWNTYYEKRDSGFDFAPTEPYAPITKGSRVYSHWEDIIAGMVPFGYTIKEVN